MNGVCISNPEQWECSVAGRNWNVLEAERDLYMLICT